jgi:hypothetical protein
MRFKRLFVYLYVVARIGSLEEQIEGVIFQALAHEA